MCHPVQGTQTLLTLLGRKTGWHWRPVSWSFFTYLPIYSLPCSVPSVPVTNAKLLVPLDSCCIQPMRGTGKMFQVDTLHPHSVPPHLLDCSGHVLCSSGRGGPSLMADVLKASWHTICPSGLVLGSGCLAILCWFLNSSHTFVNSSFIKLLFFPFLRVNTSEYAPAACWDPE